MCVLVLVLVLVLVCVCLCACVCLHILTGARSGFPGAQPVSMDRRNLRFLEQKPYKVSWKADGTRWVGLHGWLIENRA